MYSHLCMKYIFFLLAIATIVAGIPLEETRNLPLEETRSLSSIKDINARCTDHNYPVYRSSFCRNKNTVRNVCESQDLPGTYTTSDTPCAPNFSCVDFVLPNNPNPFALCISDDTRNTWDNDRNRGVVCSSTRNFRLNANTITIGMTTYDTNLNPIQVNMLDGYVNNDFLGIAFQQHNFSKTYNNYDESKGIKMCFGAGSDQEVTAVYGILIPGSTINELTIVSSE
ncbi:hypothetical protein RclHR1_14760004 [Rhizophagus clarus]|uniref:Uncharacterized protein n=1 Tax=Rhizophagus clarus TaxID=94130 RepID=A0A2Z6QHT6_9GLOM|nr:hypothetical protein RclHR1_14760004 [Rhizophagus clarus]GES75663.1 hypothetical protein GLOIN_2v1796228 [Rhizophagus clarus]